MAFKIKSQQSKKVLWSYPGDRRVLNWDAFDDKTAPFIKPVEKVFFVA